MYSGLGVEAKFDSTDIMQVAVSEDCEENADDSVIDGSCEKENEKKETMAMPTIQEESELEAAKEDDELVVCVDQDSNQVHPKNTK